MGCKWATVQHLHVELWQPQNLTKLSQLQRLPCIRFFLNVSATKKHKGLVDALDFIKIRQCYQGLHTFSGSVLKSLSKHMFFSRSYCSNKKRWATKIKAEIWRFDMLMKWSGFFRMLIQSCRPVGPLRGERNLPKCFANVYSITWGVRCHVSPFISAGLWGFLFIQVAGLPQVSLRWCIHHVTNLKSLDSLVLHSCHRICFLWSFRKTAIWRCFWR